MKGRKIKELNPTKKYRMDPSGFSGTHLPLTRASSFGRWQGQGEAQLELLSQVTRRFPRQRDSESSPTAAGFAVISFTPRHTEHDSRSGTMC